MRVVYSVLKEIHNKEIIPQGRDYGLKTFEFDEFIRLLEEKGYLERVLRVNDEIRLGPSRLTEKGLKILETYKHYETDYPARKFLKEWVEIDKERYSNGAEESY